MHTQSYEAYLSNLEASAISITDVAWNDFCYLIILAH